MKRKSTLVVLGTLLASVFVAVWRLWRHFSIPVEQTEVDLNYTTASPHLIEAQLLQGDKPIQFIHEGIGPLFYRRYYIDLKNTEKSKQELIKEVEKNLNRFTANDMAIFEKIEPKDTSAMNVGDDYFIHIAGPWNGPVRVIDIRPSSFSFITLDRHLEAGEIQFRFIDHPNDDDLTRFEIRSWSRSRDRIVAFFYTVIPIVRQFQLRMWVYFCQRVVEVSEAKAIDEVQVVTHRIPQSQYYESLNTISERWKQYHPQLTRLQSSKINFDLDQRESFTSANGWNIDTYQIELPEEAPGDPEPNRSWALAKEVLLNYEFPDPNLITGIFRPDDPLKSRHMMLEARFLFFTFEFGVRISDVIDEQREDKDKGLAQVWGYSYQTLEGHFEMGEITFEIWKFLDSGQVEFRIHSYSKTGPIDNPFYRLGFALFGRRLQIYFAQSAMERMQQLVLNRLTNRETELETPDIHTI